MIGLMTRRLSRHVGEPIRLLPAGPWVPLLPAGASVRPLLPIGASTRPLLYLPAGLDDNERVNSY
jgi:hypothetical protein